MKTFPWSGQEWPECKTTKEWEHHFKDKGYPYWNQDGTKQIHKEVLQLFPHGYMFKKAEERGITYHEPKSYHFDDFYISVTHDQYNDQYKRVWTITVRYCCENGPIIRCIGKVSMDFDNILLGLHECESELCEKKHDLSREMSFDIRRHKIDVHEDQQEITDEAREKKNEQIWKEYREQYGLFADILPFMGGGPKYK